MEYKVLAVGAQLVGSLEQMLNEAALDGYQMKHAWDSNNRLIIILERIGINPPRPTMTSPVLYEDSTPIGTTGGPAPYGYKKDGTPKKAPGRKVTPQE